MLPISLYEPSSVTTGTLVCIPGFLGDPESFLAQFKTLFPASRIIVFHLPAHGKLRGNALNVNLEQLIDLMHDTCLHYNIVGAYWYGYSMGGRLASLCCVRFPELCKQLILEAAHFGFETKSEKQKVLAEFQSKLKNYQELSSESFILQWYGQALFFKTQQLLAESSKAYKVSLVSPALFLFQDMVHVSKQPYFIPDLNCISIDLVYFVGEHDQKYLNYIFAIKQCFLNIKIRVIEGADHDTRTSSTLHWKNTVLETLQELF